MKDATSTSFGKPPHISFCWGPAHQLHGQVTISPSLTERGGNRIGQGDENEMCSEMCSRTVKMPFWCHKGEGCRWISWLQAEIRKDLFTGPHKFNMRKVLWAAKGLIMLNWVIMRFPKPESVYPTTRPWLTSSCNASTKDRGFKPIEAKKEFTKQRRSIRSLCCCT